MSIYIYYILLVYTSHTCTYLIHLVHTISIHTYTILYCVHTPTLMSLPYLSRIYTYILSINTYILITLYTYIVYTYIHLISCVHTSYHIHTTSHHPSSSTYILPLVYTFLRPRHPPDKKDFVLTCLH